MRNVNCASCNRNNASSFSRSCRRKPALTRSVLTKPSSTKISPAPLLRRFEQPSREPCQGARAQKALPCQHITEPLAKQIGVDLRDHATHPINAMCDAAVASQLQHARRARAVQRSEHIAERRQPKPSRELHTLRLPKAAPPGQVSGRAVSAADANRGEKRLSLLSAPESERRIEACAFYALLWFGCLRLGPRRRTSPGCGQSCPAGRRRRRGASCVN